MNIGILGGGLSGISLQRFLIHDSEVLEKEERVGGLCRTFYKDGFGYDIGGHILFSRNQEVLNRINSILGENCARRRRNNKILYKGRYVKYPFENGLDALDKEETYQCLIGYLQNKHAEPTNFKEWIYYNFGDGMADKYLIPYNQKIWKFPLERIGLEWVERVPKPPLEDVIKSALGIETEGYLHQLYFYYPKRFGIEGLIQSLLEEGSQVTTGFEVREIQRRGDKWVVSNGEGEKGFDKLVITIPIIEAVRLIKGIPTEALKAAESLNNNSVRIVLVGMSNRSLLDKSAIYIPDPSVIAHRVCFMGYFSKSMVPEDCSSLIAEITTSKGSEIEDLPDEELIERVIKDLHRIGIIDRRDVIVTDTKHIEYAYVIYDLTHRKNMEILKECFASLGIMLLGRFAEFEYINMDEVLRRSLKLASELNAKDL